MIRFHTAVQHMLVPAGEVTPHPDNYNNGDIEELRDSLIKNGCYRPVYVASDGMIVGGHGLYTALLAEGATHIPVLRLDIPSTDRQGIARVLISDNEIARRSIRDDAQLLKLVQEDLDLDLVGTGLTEFDLLRIQEEIDLPLAGLGEGSNPWPVLQVPCSPELYEEWHVRLEDRGIEPHELLAELMEDE